MTVVIRILIGLTAAGLTVGTARAQTVLDGSDRRIDGHLWTSALSAVTRQLRDPVSAQYRNLRPAEHGLCGEVNAKSLFGGYVGFSAFHFDPRLPTPTIVNPLADSDAMQLTRDLLYVAGCVDEAGRYRR